MSIYTLDMFIGHFVFSSFKEKRMLSREKKRNLQPNTATQNVSRQMSKVVDNSGCTHGSTCEHRKCPSNHMKTPKYNTLSNIKVKMHNLCTSCTTGFRSCVQHRQKSVVSAVCLRESVASVSNTLKSNILNPSTAETTPPASQISQSKVAESESAFKCNQQEQLQLLFQQIDPMLQHVDTVYSTTVLREDVRKGVLNLLDMAKKKSIMHSGNLQVATLMALVDKLPITSDLHVSFCTVKNTDRRKEMFVWSNELAIITQLMLVANTFIEGVLVNGMFTSKAIDLEIVSLITHNLIDLTSSACSEHFKIATAIALLTLFGFDNAALLSRYLFNMRLTMNTSMTTHESGGEPLFKIDCASLCTVPESLSVQQVKICEFLIGLLDTLGLQYHNIYDYPVKSNSYTLNLSFLRDAHCVNYKFCSACFRFHETNVPCDRIDTSISERFSELMKHSTQPSPSPTSAPAPVDPFVNWYSNYTKSQSVVGNDVTTKPVAVVTPTTRTKSNSSISITTTSPRAYTCRHYPMLASQLTNACAAHVSPYTVMGYEFVDYESQDGNEEYVYYTELKVYK